MKDLADYCSGSRDTSRHPTRHWHPSIRSRKLKSKGSSAGNGRCVSSNKEIWQCHVTCEHKHSHDNEGHTLVPMDVSQMSSNALKNESGDQEHDTYQYDQDQDGEGAELYAVKGKVKGGFKGTCFKCGMRKHKADRC